MINTENLKIGILSKRNEGFTKRLGSHLEDNGHSIEVFLEENLIVNNNLLNKDFYILKSKKLIFFYAAYFLISNQVVVIPDTRKSYLCKNRIDSHFSLQKEGFNSPKVYMGTAKSIKSKLRKAEYPLVEKPIMSSGSMGVRIINSGNDLNLNSDGVLYLEKYIEGTHYLVYFIEDQVCICEKQPLANEHQKVKRIANDDEIKDLSLKWKNSHKLLFGHLDLIRERESNTLFIVDVGTFPEFSNWHSNVDPVKSICNLILKSYYKTKRQQSE